MLCRWPFHQPASRLRLALTRVVDRQGQLVYEYCKSSHWQVEFMLCAICRSTFTRQFFRVLTPGPSSLDFSRESPAKDMWCYVGYVYNGELVSFIGNQWVGIFPPKSKILFVLSLALQWCRNFQDGTIPVGGDTWTSCSAERKNNKNNNKNERDICQLAYAKSFAKTTGTNSPDGHATIQPKWRNIKNGRWTVRQQWLVVTRPSADCRTTFFRRFKQFGKLLKKKSLNGHATVVGGHATVGWLSNNVFRRLKQFRNFLKKVTEGHATVVGGHATVGWLSNNAFLTFQAIRKFLKKDTEGHATVAGGHATVVWLSNNVFLTFQAIRKNFEKSHWRSRDSVRRSRDRWMTVKQRFLDVSSI